MEDYFRNDFETTAAPRRRDNLFLWTVFILLLIGAALTCWLGSFYIFGHPEKPRSYRILQKLHKLEAPKRFELTAGPPGEYLSAQKLFERYNTFTRLQLQNENDALLRDYINNYGATKKLVPYVVGRYNILDSYELKPTDLFPSGVVALAQSMDFPQVLIEHVYTADQSNVPVLRKMLQTGLDVKLERQNDLAAVIHIERLFNGSLQFTVVPLLYGSYALKQGSGTFNLEPPPQLNVAAGAPIIRTPALQEALRTYAEYKKKNMPEASALDKPSAAPSASPTAPTEELVRVDTSPPPGEAPAETATTPLPVAKSAPAKPVAKAGATPAIPTGKPVPAPSTPPTTLAMMSPKPAPALSPAKSTAPTAAAASPTPRAVSPQGVPLTPFLASAPAPTLANAGASWRLYQAGQMPRGRVVEPQDASSLADRGVGGERLYLRGQFVVTASGDNRAVLRTQGGGLSNLLKPGTGATRVIVEYPSSITPPVEGATFSRDETRPFQVTDVRRGADGQINVYVREITTP